jgi:hypothetical protein
MPTAPTAPAAAFAPGAPLYTVEQANRTLPYVGRVVADVVRAHAEWRQCLAAIDADRRGVARPAGRSDETPLPGDPAAVRRLAAQHSADLQAALGELAALGVECRGLDVGLVDFPAVVAGEPAYLCWQLGEPAVNWWHRPDVGFGGRRPVAELDPTAAVAEVATSDAASGERP